MSNSEQNIASPCVGQCGLNKDGLCGGCYRTRDEVIGWHEASDEERAAILKNCEQRKNEAA